MKKIIILLLFSLLFASLLAEDNLDKRALKAAGLSIILPGGGQVYNGSYLKASAVAGLEGAFLSLALYNYFQSENYYDDYASSGLEVDLENYNKHYDRQQNYFFWLGATIFVSAVDAFVDAHLQNYFERKEKIHLKFEDNALLLSIKF
ncbi:MAG: DUF5683 domain-containing protein [Candidatus Cloacimonadales bacterium]